MGSLRSWRPTPSRRSTSRAASGTCSPGPSRSYVATAARSPSPSGGSGKADGQDRRGGSANGPRAARRTDPGLPRFRVPGEPNAGRGPALRTHLCGPPDVPRRTLLSLPAEGASAREPCCFAPTRRSSAPQPPQRRRHLPGAPDRRRSPSGGGRPVASPRRKRDTGLWKSIHNTSRLLPLDVPDPEAHGVTLSPTPCGLSDTGPGSSGSAPSAYCVASWSSSVGYPSVIVSFLPSPLLFVVLVRSGALGVLVRWDVLSVHINTLPPLQGSRRRRPQPCAPALLAEDYNSTLATMEDNAEVRPHPTVRCHPPPASPHSSRLARKPGSRLRTGAVLVTVASSRSNCSSDGKMLFLHPLALRVTLEEGRPPKKHDPHPIPYPSYLTTRRLTGYPGRQWVSGYP